MLYGVVSMNTVTPEISLELFQSHFREVGTHTFAGVVVDSTQPGQPGKRKETYIRTNFKNGMSITTRQELVTLEDDSCSEGYVLTIVPTSNSPRSWIRINSGEFVDAENIHRELVSLLNLGNSLSRAIDAIGKRYTSLISEAVVGSDFCFESRLDEFHHIQELALAGNVSDAILELSDLLGKEPWKTSEVPTDWWIYLMATLAYFQSDLKRLKELLADCDNNKDVVHRLINGLSKYGTVDYRRDYVLVARPKTC